MWDIVAMCGLEVFHISVTVISVTGFQSISEKGSVGQDRNMMLLGYFLPGDYHYTR